MVMRRILGVLYQAYGRASDTGSVPVVSRCQRTFQKAKLGKLIIARIADAQHVRNDLFRIRHLLQGAAEDDVIKGIIAQVSQAFVNVALKHTQSFADARGYGW